MPSDVPYRDIKKLLESYGWSLGRTRGSHHIFVCDGRKSIPIPVHKGKVKYGYIRVIERIAAQYEDDESA